jgi:hypothetical protein
LSLFVLLLPVFAVAYLVVIPEGDLLLLLLLPVFAVACFCRHPQRSEGPRYRSPHPCREHLSTRNRLCRSPLHPKPNSTQTCQAQKIKKNAKSPITTRLLEAKKYADLLLPIRYN